ncbi:MAG: DUF4160 domain-containing protein [Cyanobacteria bacterium P01_G01_bin.54]
MPKIFVDSQSNLSVYIHTDDHEPSHVHVFIGRKRSRNQANIKVALGSEIEAPYLISVHGKIGDKDVRKVLALVADH